MTIERAERIRRNIWRVIFIGFIFLVGFCVGQFTPPQFDTDDRLVKASKEGVFIWIGYNPDYKHIEEHQGGHQMYKYSTHSERAIRLEMEESDILGFDITNTFWSNWLYRSLLTALLRVGQKYEDGKDLYEFLSGSSYFGKKGALFAFKILMQGNIFDLEKVTNLDLNRSGYGYYRHRGWSDLFRYFKTEKSVSNFLK